MKPCKECGVPDIINRDQKWDSNGTIPITADPEFRMGIIEIETMRGIASDLEAIVGPSIHTMFMEGKRKYARHYIDCLLKGPLGFLVRHSEAGGKKAYQTLLQTSTSLGFGHAVLEVYERKEKVGGSIQNPYYTPFFVGDVRGGFESIERLPSKGSWQDKGDSATLLIERLDVEDKYEARFLFADKTRLPGNMKYTPCKKCKLPMELSRFKWDLAKGLITDTAAKERVFIIGLNDLNSVFTELEEAIGDAVPNAVIGRSKAVGKALVKKGVISDYNDVVKEFGIKGLAFTEVRKDKQTLHLTLKNPANKPYLVGRALGIYEGLEGTEGEVTVKQSPALMELTIQPKK